MTYTLDETLGLERISDDVFKSQTDQRYWNLIGPYGGWIAALMIKAVIADRSDARFEPVALTIDFMKAPAEGEIILRRRCDRAGRTAAFWRVDMENPDGTPCARAMVTLAPHRETLVFSTQKMPDVPPPQAVERFRTEVLPVKWAHLYETRVIKGKMGEITPDAHSLTWVREADQRPLDHVSLTALCDSPFPRLFLATGRPSNISTITMTIYFHAPMAELEEIGGDHLLADARCERSVGGFFDQHTSFYSTQGNLVAASQQMVWYDREA
ncbi:thioesterase family protein [Nitratireductor sp. XY-223]|uniref:acyl-CoA thioesterase n=1 Tax=Nitratireductor sp. XY-223 TaxID=2561926 RepID=UPI00145A8996|nr:thioesterase family protein [Nitratireductor sp. XY-223]